jgi:hypothetical protein
MKGDKADDKGAHMLMEGSAHVEIHSTSIDARLDRATKKDFTNASIIWKHLVQSLNN